MNFSNMPPEMIKHISSFCSLASKSALSLCCKKFHHIVDLQNNLLYRKTKTTPWNVTEKELYNILDLQSEQFDTQNMKYLLNMTNKSPDQQWEIVYFTTLKRDDVKLSDFDIKSSEKSRKLFHIAYLTGKFCRDRVFDKDIFSKKIGSKQLCKKSIEYCVKYFLYENDLESIVELQNQCQYSTKIPIFIEEQIRNNRYIALVQQDFSRFEELGKSYHPTVFDDADAMKKLISFKFHWPIFTPTLDTKKNALYYFIEKYKHQTYDIYCFKQDVSIFGLIEDPEFLKFFAMTRSLLIGITFSTAFLKKIVITTL